jgi:hypothetical protein
MKRIATRSFLIAIMILTSIDISYAQLKVSLNMTSHPDPYLSNWANRKETAIVTIINSGSQPVEVKFDCKINKNGSLLVNTKPEVMKTFSVPPGANQYFGEDLLPIEAVKISGNADKTAIKTGMLPAGSYEFCVALLDASNKQLTSPVCKGFVLQSYQAPVLLQPEDKSSIKQNQRPIFRWTAVSPKPNFILNYRIMVFEVLAGQSPTNALKVNRPILDQDNILSTQFQWPPDVDLPTMTQQLIWTVRAIDENGNGVGEPDGYATPFVINCPSCTSNDFSNDIVVSKGTLGGNTNKSGNNSGDTNALGSGNAKSKQGAGNNDTSNTNKANKSGNNENVAIIDNGTAVTGDTIKAGLNGEFDVIVSEITVNGDGTLTGKGTAYVGWLKVNVAVVFDKIRINAITKHLSEGGIVGELGGDATNVLLTYAQAWGPTWLTTGSIQNKVDGVVGWANNTVNDIVSWVNNVANKPLITYQSNIPPPVIPNNSLKMPFGVLFNGGDDQIVISEMIFKPTESKVNFLAQKTFTKSAVDTKLGFSGKYFIFHPTQIDFSGGRVELVEDVTIPNINNKIDFTFKKGEPLTGCYIEWTNGGVNDFGLGIEVAFTRDWLIPIPSPNPSSKVVASLSGNGTSLKDILISGNLPKCEIVGSNGVLLELNTIELDLSELRNPTKVIFPANYPYLPDETWKGLYINTFGLTLPDTWKTGANNVTITANNIIIDDMGLTTKIKALNVLTLTAGNVANLSASIDEINLSILNSSLESGEAKGKVILPFSSVANENSLDYTATFLQAPGGNSFQFVIVPTQDITADVLKGKLTLLNTSFINFVASAGDRTLSVKLNGTLKWNKPNLSASPSPIPGLNFSVLGNGLPLKMELSFENLGLNYTTNPTTGNDAMTFNLGNWSFASPQKFLANFPVTIKNFKYKPLTAGPQVGSIKELFRGAMTIDIVANLTEDIGGSTTFGAAFAIAVDKSAKKLLPQFKGVFLDSAYVYADIPAVKIVGGLKLYSGDPKFGDGFSANIAVSFTALSSLQIKADVQFGSTTYNGVHNMSNGQFYRYFKVGADVMLPKAIPFLTGVGFYGFGGGVFYNMNPILQAASSAPGSTGRPYYVFDPDKGYKGLAIRATIATMPKFKTLNTDLELMAGFNASNGLDLISLSGDVWLAADLAERNAAKIKGGFVTSYNFPDKLFNMVAALTINVPGVITTDSPIGFVMNVNGKTNKWYFKAGTPSNTNAVKVFGLNLYSYLMFGNDLGSDIPNGFTQKFKNSYAAAIGSSPSMAGPGTGGTGDNTMTGKGIATGVGVNFDKDYTQHLKKGLCRDWSLDAHLNVGSEIDLAFLEQIGCQGLNGYRAYGDVGLYFNLTSTLTGATYRPKVCDTKSSNLFTIKVGAWLHGEFPSPVYLYGSVNATVGIFDDLVNINFSRSFDYGSPCTGTNVVTANAAQEDKANDLKNKLISYIAPNTSYNFPITQTVNVKYSLTPDGVFDVSENQGDGTIKNRTFKMVTTQKLESKNLDGSWKTESIKSKANNVGEYQYYIKSNIILNDNSINLSLAKSVKVSNVNTNSSNAIVSSKSKSINVIDIPASIPPPPEPNYPNPSPEPLNNLVINQDYRFTVTATLMELSSGVWTIAKTRAGANVTESKTKSFRTGPLILNSAAAEPILNKFNN